MSSAMAKQGVILIADDTPTNLEVLFDFLAKSGFKILVAEDGESAIQKAEYASPDLILLDVLMPKMDGFETCRHLKNRPSTQEIPIIFMTALAETEDKIKGLQLGAVDYITKPLQAEEVLARVKTQLRLRQLTQQLQVQNQQLQQQIEERQRTEQQLRQQAALLDIATDAILVRDLEGQILYWNKGAEHLYGWPATEALGQNADQLLYSAPPQRQAIQQALDATGEWRGELQQITKAEQPITVESRWTLVRDAEQQPRSILTVNTDITETKKLQAQFLQAQRLESLGTLASGIAHDLNNLLAPILMAVQLLGLKLEDDRSLQLLEILEGNVKRGAELVKQVLSFARGIAGERVSLQIGHLITDIATIAQQTFSKAIEIRVEMTTAGLWLVTGDATQLHQVLMNLCVNARDAMPDGGTLTIAATNRQVNEQDLGISPDLRTGPYVVITVSDTGVGIPPTVQDRIFEPFFTTKPFGQGTGLGLSTVLGIVKSHGGVVCVESQLGKGTRFRVYLPATETAIAIQAPPEEGRRPFGQGELLLVVDDEPAVREATQVSLESYGYRVLGASDGIEGLALYAQHGSEIQAVVMDMMMPHPDGLATIAMLQKLNSEIKIIAVSGLKPGYGTAVAKNPNIKSFLGKPYTLEELLKALQAILHPQSSASNTERR
jgi:two-component system, cell cycle sensor histidine kinase and response regulator CckA